MTVMVNGAPRELPEPCDVAQAIVALGFADRRIVVALNNELVARADHAATVVRPGDTLEILEPMSGG